MIVKESEIETELEKCIKCMFCLTTCPAFQSQRDRAIPTDGPMGWIQTFNYMIKWGLERNKSFYSSIYECSTCEACNQICMVGLDIVDLIIRMRRHIVEQGFLSPSQQNALKSVYLYGNPWGKFEREKWTKGLYIKKLRYGENAEILYFVGCMSAYDIRSQEVAKSMVSVLNHAKVDYAILGNDERCCGSSVLRMGEQGLFEMIADKNREVFEKYGVERVVTTSPHCYNAFKNDYPDLGFEVQHYTQLVLELIEQKKLEFPNKLEKVVTYHDPCFLGRNNKIYQTPRKILESIPGLTLVEMDRTRENSFCCGGGGGKMWLEEKCEERPCLIRSKEAVALKPNVVATACPFCLTNLEDGIKVLDKDKEVEVKDIIELVKEAST